MYRRYGGISNWTPSKGCDKLKKRETVSADVRINLTLVLPRLFLCLFFLLLPLTLASSYVDAVEAVSFISALSASSSVGCALPSASYRGIKLRGGCLYSRGFSNYMFNLFSRSRLAPGIFRQVAGPGEKIPPRGSHGVSEGERVLSHPSLRQRYTRTLLSAERGA